MLRVHFFTTTQGTCVHKDDRGPLTCETKIGTSVLPFIACVIRMTALLQVSPIFKERVKMHECNNNFAFPSQSSIYTAI